MTFNSSNSYPKIPVRPDLSDEGMATGVVMILTMILMAISLGILGLSQEHSARDVRYTNLQSGLEIIQANIYIFGQHTSAWNSTVYYNKTRGAMTCINSGANCPAIIYEEIALRLPGPLPEGIAYYDHGAADGSTSAIDGFTTEGKPCDFNGSRITSGCVLRAELRWNPYCGTTPCLVGPAKVLFYASYSMPVKDQNDKEITQKGFLTPFNANRYGEAIPFQRNEWR